jgi:hypothetical protein
MDWKMRLSRYCSDDFMFQLTLEEGNLMILSRSQIATLKRGENVKYRPYVFTEYGAVMLANVLRSPVAVRARIQVVHGGAEKRGQSGRTTY